MTILVNQLNYSVLRQPILKALSFTVKAGELLMIVGGNGSGKTTLLKILARLITPNSGCIEWQGEKISHSEAYQNSVGYLGHKNGLKRDLSLIENLNLARVLHPNALSIERISEAFNALNLEALKNKPVRQMSYGEKRKSAVLRLILMNKKIWLLDEPFVGLDAGSAAQMEREINHHCSKGGLVLLSSHRQQAFNPSTQFLIL